MSASIATILLAGIISSVMTPSFSLTNLDHSNLHETAFAKPAISTSIDVELALLSPITPVTVAPSAPVQADFGVFDSVAISAAKLPAAAKWQEIKQTDYSAFFSDDCVAQGFGNCDSRLAINVRGITAAAAELGDRDMLDLVNRTVNAAMTYRDDSKVWGVGDYWATPVDMAGKGAGDCEDYAIAKYWTLRSLGIADEQLQIVVLQDTRRQLFHAVLVAHMESGSYVLDNVSNRLAMDSAYGQYQPIMSFAGGKNFIHGFESGSRDVAAMPADLSAIAPGVGM